MNTAGLRAADPENLAFPVEIVQAQATDFSGPQPIGDEQHQDRPVALINRTISLNGGQQTQDIFAPQPFRHGLVHQEAGCHDPRGQPRRAPTMGFSKPEECSQTLRVIVDRAAAPSATVVLRRDDIVDVGHPDGAQGNALPANQQMKRLAAWQ